MRKSDILTAAVMGVGLLGVAIVGAIAYRFDAWQFRNRVRSFATEFPDRMHQLRDDLMAEEMNETIVIEEEGQP